MSVRRNWLFFLFLADLQCNSGFSSSQITASVLTASIMAASGEVGKAAGFLSSSPMAALVIPDFSAVPWTTILFSSKLSPFLSGWVASEAGGSKEAATQIAADTTDASILFSLSVSLFFSALDVLPATWWDQSSQAEMLAMSFNSSLGFLNFRQQHVSLFHSQGWAQTCFSTTALLKLAGSNQVSHQNGWGHCEAGGKQSALEKWDGICCLVSPQL